MSGATRGSRPPGWTEQPCSRGRHRTRHVGLRQGPPRAPWPPALPAGTASLTASGLSPFSCRGTRLSPLEGPPRIAPHPILCRTGDCLQFTRKETGRRRVPPVAMVSEPASPPRPVLLTQSPCVDGWGPRGLRVPFETNPHTDSAHVRRGLRIRHGFLGVSAGVWPLQAFILTAEAWAHARGSAVGNVVSLLVSRARPCCPVEVTSSYVQRLVAASSLPQGPC